MPDGMELLLGNGSDELIQILALAVNRPGAVLMGVEPSFVMFRMIATLHRHALRRRAARAGFQPGSARMLSEIERDTSRRSPSSPIRTIRPAICSMRMRSAR